MPTTVFISYSRKNSAYANALRDACDRASLNTFLDTRSMEPGEDFMRQTYRAMANCQVFVLLWSAQANDSRYVFLELNQAINARKFIIPVMLDGTSLPGPISNIQAMGIETPEGMPRVTLEIARWRKRRQRRKSAFIALTTLLTAIAIGTGLWAADQQEELPGLSCHAGKVLDHNGKPLAGIVVGMATRQSQLQDTTNAQGEFSLCADSADLLQAPLVTAFHGGKEVQASLNESMGGQVTLRFPAPEAPPIAKPPKLLDTSTIPRVTVAPPIKETQTPAPPQTLTFTVKDTNNKSIHGAIVKLYKGGEVIPGWDTLTTDKDGQVSIKLQHNTPMPDKWEASYNGMTDWLPLYPERKASTMNLGLR